MLEVNLTLDWYVGRGIVNVKVAIRAPSANSTTTNKYSTQSVQQRNIRCAVQNDKANVRVIGDFDRSKSSSPCKLLVFATRR